MAVNLAPNPIWQYEDAAGLPLNGGKLFFYVAGSSTKQNTYTDATGATPNANPIILNALGQPATGIFFTAGQTYKAVLAPATDTDPPLSPIWTRDVLYGINDVSATASEWQASPAPTFVSATQFTLVGDQTSTFQVNRRVKATVTAGTVYGTISVSAFAALTTVTLLIDSGALDAGLSSVSYGLLAATNPSVPASYVQGNAARDIQDFRLTLTTVTPVTTADVTGATTIYASPYKGKSIALYDGSATWNVRQSAEFSLALGTLTSALPYDIFCYDNAGVPTLEFLAWTSATARATALVLQDGILVKSGATTRRYLGTFYTSSTTTTEDSKAKRFLWNYYNRVLRKMLVAEATASWTYSSVTIRQMNGAATNQLDFVIGVSEDAISATASTNVTTSTATFRSSNNAIGLDATTAVATDSTFMAVTQATPQSSSLFASYMGYPGIGRHFLAALERGSGADVQTWFGVGTGNFSVISGVIPG